MVGLLCELLPIFPSLRAASDGKILGMTNFAKNCTSTVIPGLRYKNATAMIDWLCDAFGFEKKAVYSGPNGAVNHAELTFGNGMIMLGSADNNQSPSAKLITQPEDIGGRVTQAPYLVVADCDGLYERAKAAGATIVAELREMDYGGKAFSCKDPEGHLWHFGGYDPWEPQEG